MKINLIIPIILAIVLLSPVYAATSVEITNVQEIEETDSSFSWSENWFSEESSMASGGTWKSTNISGATVNISFEGDGISLVYVRGPGAPTARLYLDAMYLDDLNASSETEVGTVKRIIAQDLPSGTHTLSIVVTVPGTKNLFIIDGIEVTSSTISAEKTDVTAYFIFILLAVIVAFLLYTYRGEIKKKIPKPKIEKIRKTDRMADLMKTLDETDIKIIDFLIEQNGKSKQNTIRHTLQMPKSTLSKRMKALQRKNIIELKKFGKTNIVTLTSWFTQQPRLQPPNKKL